MQYLFWGILLLNPGHVSCLSLRRMTLELPTLLVLAETEASYSPRSGGGGGDSVCVLVFIFSSQSTVTSPSFPKFFKKKEKEKVARMFLTSDG